jgi:hypothetical protein
MVYPCSCGLVRTRQYARVILTCSCYPEAIVVRLRTTNKHFWRCCREWLSRIYEPDCPRIFCFSFLFLPLPPLSMEGCACTHLPPDMSESEEPFSSGPIPFSSCLIDPFLMRLVQENSFSGMSNENPYDHVRDIGQLCSTQGRTRMAQDALKRSLFPFFLSRKASIWYLSHHEISNFRM